jgi:hypothetical protein
MVGAPDHAAARFPSVERRSPYLLFSSACLINLGAERGSSSLAPSDWCSSSLFVSSQAHGSPGSLKLDSRACHAQLPTTGNSRSGLHQDGLPGAVALPSATLFLILGGRPGMGRCKTVPVSRCCFTERLMVARDTWKRSMIWAWDFPSSTARRTCCLRFCE